MLAASAGVMGCKLQCVGRVLNGSPHRPEDVPLLGRQRTPACQDIGQAFQPGRLEPQRAQCLVGPRKLAGACLPIDDRRSEEHTSELQSLMRISYAVFCLKKKKNELEIYVNIDARTIDMTPAT